MVLLKRELYFPKDREGGPTFSIGVQVFSRVGGGI